MEIARQGVIAFDPMGDSTEIERTVADCAAGSGRRCGELLSFFQQLELSDPQRDEMLDGLAKVAPSSPTATDALVRLIYQERFVRAEIRKILINDTSAAEEALQETALAMVRGLPSFRGESMFRTWVSSIGRNQAINILRRKRPTSELGEQPSEVARYSSMLADRTDVIAALAELPDEFREAVRLRDIEQKSYEEIAVILGIKLNTVRSRLARGRARLAASFEADL